MKETKWNYKKDNYKEKNLYQKYNRGEKVTLEILYRRKNCIKNIAQDKNGITKIRVKELYYKIILEERLMIIDYIHSI